MVMFLLQCGTIDYTETTHCLDKSRCIQIFVCYPTCFAIENLEWCLIFPPKIDFITNVILIVELKWLSLTPKRNPKSTLQTTHSDISLSLFHVHMMILWGPRVSAQHFKPVHVIFADIFYLEPKWWPNLLFQYADLSLTWLKRVFK